jgi:uncharacterized membrane protein
VVHLLASSSTSDLALEWIEIAALAIEILAVVMIVAAIAYATVHYLLQAIRGRHERDIFREYKTRLARALLLSLEILVAADVVRTVALETTLEAVVGLGLLVFIRTFLSWSLAVEIEGRWPWQPRPGQEEAETEGD